MLKLMLRNWHYRCNKLTAAQTSLVTDLNEELTAPMLFVLAAAVKVGLFVVMLLSV